MARTRSSKPYWVGIVDGKVHSYRADSYYHGVLHADLFSSKAAAKRCYDEVKAVRLKLDRRPERKGA